ncbi:N-6 DNA methylase [Paraburkholderia adhaesiva]|uniref:N-6 DNA methylase n=1 Tax=Paraburkholderia adhaesiva TaxID=2883244 RepID=UPI001F2900B5|nr:N-6 DNA methylase [Paraburkholderia adhaesiva]
MSRKNRNPFPIIADPHKHAIVEGLRSLSQKRHPYTVFCDFIEISAILLSNRTDFSNVEKRKIRYAEIIKKYTDDEQSSFATMLHELVLCYQQRVDSLGPAGLRNDIENIGDILGSIYMQLEIANERMAQFFTPYNVSTAMATMMFGGENQVREMVREHGFATLLDPCCGASGMIVAAAQAFHQLGFNYVEQFHATCVDIDPVCVHMSYLQLSLLGIPAVIIHGNSLTMESWDTWYTVPHILAGWGRRLRRRREQEKEKEAIRQVQSLLQSAGETPAPEATPTQETHYASKLRLPPPAARANPAPQTPRPPSP